MFIFLALLAAGILLVFVGLRALEKKLIYFPPRYPAGFPPPQSYAGEVEDIWLQTSDGVKINAFFRPDSESKKVILWFHGNAENIGYGLVQMRTLAKVGANILAVDYRGYGRSEGRPNEAGVYRDADAAYDYLVKERGFRPDDIVHLRPFIGWRRGDQHGFAAALWRVDCPEFIYQCASDDAGNFRIAAG